MHRLWILELPLILALTGITAGPLLTPPKAAAHDDDRFRYDDHDRDDSDDHDNRNRFDEDDDLGSEVSVRYFRDALSPHGEWFRVPAYGWAWRPYRVSTDWRPYTVGRWLYTDYGWTWVSDEPWGWAPYHYGRWAWDARYGGWVWIPGRRWAPAWVDWREGDDYIGWAPLPPEAVWESVVGIPTRTIVIEPRHYCFVETRYIAESNLHSYIALPARNVTIIHNTTNVTNYTIVNNRVANRSIREATIEKAIGHQLPRYPIQEVERAAPRSFRVNAQGHVRTTTQVERRNEQRPGFTARGSAAGTGDVQENVHGNRVGVGAAARERAQVDQGQFDRERDGRERIDRERAEAERRQAERLRDEARRREEARMRPAARERDAERQGAAHLQHQEFERRDAAERAQRAAHEQAVRRQDVEQVRERAARRVQEEAARRRQAEAEHHKVTPPSHPRDPRDGPGQPPRPPS